jgi:hypothetical protein
MPKANKEILNLLWSCDLQTLQDLAEKFTDVSIIGKNRGDLINAIKDEIDFSQLQMVLPQQNMAIPSSIIVGVADTIECKTCGN